MQTWARDLMLMAILLVTRAAALVPATTAIAAAISSATISPTAALGRRGTWLRSGARGLRRVRLGTRAIAVEIIRRRRIRRPRIRRGPRGLRLRCRLTRLDRRLAAVATSGTSVGRTHVRLTGATTRIRRRLNGGLPAIATTGASIGRTHVGLAVATTIPRVRHGLDRWLAAIAGPARVVRIVRTIMGRTR